MNSTNSLLNQYNEAVRSCQSDEEISAVQKELLLPLIHSERLTFIQAEYARLQSVMGDEYHIGTDAYIFHPLPESEDKNSPVLGNPKELSLTELTMLPQLEKRIPRLGTMSYMPLFRMHPTDSLRLNLLADMEEKMTIGRLCTTQQIDALLTEHDEYVKFKTEWDDVVVITK